MGDGDGADDGQSEAVVVVDAGEVHPPKILLIRGRAGRRRDVELAPKASVSELDG
jgi:hypothetical protein